MATIKEIAYLLHLLLFFHLKKMLVSLVLTDLILLLNFILLMNRKRGAVRSSYISTFFISAALARFFLFWRTFATRLKNSTINCLWPGFFVGSLWAFEISRSFISLWRNLPNSTTLWTVAWDVSGRVVPFWSMFVVSRIPLMRKFSLLLYCSNSSEWAIALRSVLLTALILFCSCSSCSSLHFYKSFVGCSAQGFLDFILTICNKSWHWLFKRRLDSGFHSLLYRSCNNLNHFLVVSTIIY